VEQKKMESPLQPPAASRFSHCPALDRPAVYQIVVQGHLDANWADWLSGMTFRQQPDSENGLQTTLSGLVRDQAALRGLLGKLWDLNLTLISVNRTGSESA
jgi:hypothetical protein